MAAPRRAASRYQQALLDARANAQGLSAKQLRLLVERYREAIRDVTRESGAGIITSERAASLRRQLSARIGAIEDFLLSSTRSTVRLTVTQLVEKHVAVHKAIVKSAALPQLQVRRVLASFDAVNDRALQALTLRRGVPLQTIIHRNMQDAVPALDTLLQSAVARGVPTARVTQDVAYLLSGGDPAVATREAIKLSLYGLKDADVSGFKTLWSDSRRIAVTETNNALREGNRASLEASTIVAGAKWQTSGRHFLYDVCDVLAETDAYGLGDGVYPPERWPVAPHPYCACYQGDVVFRDVSQWGSPRTSVPALRIDPSSMRLPSELSRKSGTSVARQSAMRSGLAAALGR